MSPTLTIAAWRGPSALSDQLARAGHRVTYPCVAADIAAADLVLLEGSADFIERAAAECAPFVRPRQMFWHTNLDHGAQLLDDVEVAGAVVMCAHNIVDNVWVTSAADELGETVIALLLGELGQVTMPITDADRPLVATAQHLRALQRVVRADALALLRQANPNFEAVADAFDSAELPPLRPLDREPVGGEGVRRLVEVLERRAAQQREEDL